MKKNISHVRLSDFRIVNIGRRLNNLSIIFVLIFLVVLIAFNFLTIGTKKYRTQNSNIELTIPSFSYFEEECCMFSATFKSIRGIISLKSEMNHIIKNYKKIHCNKKTYYYNELENYTITEYGVTNKFILNEFWIVYTPGNYCN